LLAMLGAQEQGAEASADGAEPSAAPSEPAGGAAESSPAPVAAALAAVPETRLEQTAVIPAMTPAVTPAPTPQNPVVKQVVKAPPRSSRWSFFGSKRAEEHPQEEPEAPEITSGMCDHIIKDLDAILAGTPLFPRP
jgi:hypothetical protein